MQIVFDFVEGKIPFEEFWNAWNTDLEIAHWLDQIDLLALPAPEKEHSELLGYRISIQKHANGHIVPILKKQLYPDPKSPNKLRQATIFDYIAVAVTTAYPNIQPTNYYWKESDFFFDAVGDSYGGCEVEAYVDKLLQEFPPTMGKTRRIKAAKEKIREAFHIEGKKYPRWAQDAEWPMGKNSPMEYLSQRRDGELVELRFRDVDTGEVRIVEQFY